MTASGATRRLLPNGDLLTTYSSPQSIRILYAANGTMGTLATGVTANDLVANPAGDLAFTQMASGNAVVKFVPAGSPISAAVTVASADALGTCGYTADGSPARGFAFNTPYGMTLALAANRSIYIGATGRQLLHFQPPHGNGTAAVLVGRGSYTGCSGSPGPRVSMNQPHGVEVDGAGNVYVADRLNSRVWRIAPDGIATTIVGNPVPLGTLTAPTGYSGDDGPAAVARLNNPTDLAFDAVTGALYVVDRGNARIRYINLTATPPTIHAHAGSASVDASLAPGLRPTDTGLVGPHGLAIDPDRRILYVAEETGARVRGFPLKD